MPFPSGLVILAHHGRDVGALPPAGHHRAPAPAGAAGGLVRTATSGRGCQPGCHQAGFWHRIVIHHGPPGSLLRRRRGAVPVRA
jgi:hypothetical protein